MIKAELFELVDIETGEDFIYFENFADLITKKDLIFDFSECKPPELREYIVNIGELS